MIHIGMPVIMLHIIGVIIMEDLPDRLHLRHLTNRSRSRSLISPTIIPTIPEEIINQEVLTIPEEGISRTHQNVPEGVAPVEIPVRRAKEDFVDKNKDMKRSIRKVAPFFVES